MDQELTQRHHCWDLSMMSTMVEEAVTMTAYCRSTLVEAEPQQLDLDVASLAEVEQCRHG